MSIFTPPTVNIRPPYLPDSDPAQVALWKHFANRAVGVNVFALSDGSFVQDYPSDENSNTNIPYPWNPDDPSAPYVRVHNWDGTDTNISHDVWIEKVYYGGRSHEITDAEATALSGYTAHGSGYSGCITDG